MKKVYILVTLFMLCGLTGCGNTQKLVCTSSNIEDEIKSYSTLEIKVRKDRVSDMKFTVEMEFPEEYQNSLTTIASNIKYSKPYMDVSIVDGKIRLVTRDDAEGFLGIEMDQEITYGELKEVLELQDFKCE